ncbi:MAG TPA: RluA family pseudouridine synthase [Vicinamibacteria bacterium]|nr:RluA family pseudouridine synthase [Vicinamibacteria bacterium]
MRLDLALIGRHPELSRRKAREVIEKGQVTVGGATVLEAGREVASADEVRWDVNRPARSRARSSLPLLYRDEALVIVDKPPGLLAVPTSPEARDEDTALRRVQDFARHLHPRRPYVGVVHRIDRDTSGALAFALSPDVRSRLRSLFRAHDIERRYLALVHGVPREDHGAVDAAIHEEYAAGRRRLARGREPALAALTRWTVVERFPSAALLEVELETGRQHQIRLHLAHIGHPLVGERVYTATPGARAPVAPRQMLHARLLAFAHPLTGAPVRAESPLPPDFRRALSALRRGPRSTDLG